MENCFCEKAKAPLCCYYSFTEKNDYIEEFDEEYTQIKAKYIRLTRKKEEYEAYRKNR